MRAATMAVSFRLSFLSCFFWGFFQNAAGRSSRSWNPGFVPELGPFWAENDEAIGRYPFEVRRLAADFRWLRSDRF
jgi:hypothetical protein